MQGRFLAAIGLAVLVAAEAGCMASAPLSDPPVFDDKPPFLALSIARQPSADFAGAPSAASVRTKENQVYAGLYRFEAGNGTLDFGLDYQYTRYVYDGIDGRNRDLHRFEFPLRYRGALSGWRINGSIAPGLSTSSNVLKEFFDRISRDDLLVTARVEGRREWRSGNWVIGAAYNRAFGKPLLYPIAGIEFSPNEALDVRLAFPDSGFEYRISAGCSIRLWKQVTLDFGGGYEFARKHFLTDDRGVRIESEVDDQWLFLFGVRAGAAPLPYTHGSQL
jgi:hypothetical protein